MTRGDEAGTMMAVLIIYTSVAIYRDDYDQNSPVGFAGLQNKEQAYRTDGDVWVDVDMLYVSVTLDTFIAPLKLNRWNRVITLW